MVNMGRNVPGYYVVVLLTKINYNLIKNSLTNIYFTSKPIHILMKILYSSFISISAASFHIKCKLYNITSVRVNLNQLENKLSLLCGIKISNF